MNRLRQLRTSKRYVETHFCGVRKDWLSAHSAATCHGIGSCKVRNVKWYSCVDEGWTSSGMAAGIKKKISPKRLNPS